MNVYVTPPEVTSRSLRRVADALVRYAPPGITVVAHRQQADFLVLHAIGRLAHLQREIADLVAQGQRYAIVQYVLRSTLQPHSGPWLPVWQGAAVVWSYLDLRQALAEDGIQAPYWAFYHAPLGVDATMFRPPVPRPRPYVVGTSGQSWLTESVRECVLAARLVRRPAFHLGMPLRDGAVVCATNLSDADLADRYGQCAWMSGLRRIEGFELPAAEGLLCGARPILFRRSHYVQWYGDIGDFIEETDRHGVIEQLVDLFKTGGRPISAEERALAVQRFNWPRIVGDFWARCL